MGLADKIFSILEEQVSNETQKGGAPKRGTTRVRVKLPKKPPKKVEPPLKIVGYPVTSLKWDDLGLGLNRSIGYIPTKAVQIEFKNGEWILNGARAMSSVIFFIVAGAGGAFYFLKDVLAEYLHFDIRNFSEILSTLVVLIPALVGLFIRNSTMKFKPYELELLAYDREAQVLILSTLTQPGGTLALKLELSRDPRMRELEEKRLLEKLRKAHNGFITIDGLVQYDYSKLKNWSLWALVWIVIGFLTYNFYN